MGNEEKKEREGGRDEGRRDDSNALPFLFSVRWYGSAEVDLDVGCRCVDKGVFTNG